MKQQPRISIVGNVSILRFLIIIYSIVSFVKCDEKLVTSEDITELLKETIVEFYDNAIAPHEETFVTNRENDKNVLDFTWIGIFTIAAVTVLTILLLIPIAITYSLYLGVPSGFTGIGG